ncbi:UNVERIFIED_ORG: GNAT family N-acetyltransferase [Shinella sp. XGS7]|nr:GNAT family N-acetyltransferase [Shinella sp. XGS7]
MLLREELLAQSQLLETRRLCLRAPRETDLDAVYALHTDPVCNRFSPAGPLSSREAAVELLQGWQAHWQSQGFGYWAIALREQPEELIGLGGIMHRPIAGQPGLYLYFRFQPQHWGQGYASEMAQAALGLAFESLQAGAVRAVVQPANTPSRKTLERLGLLLKGSLADVPGQAPSLLYEIGSARWAQLPKTPTEPTPFGA